MELMRERYNLDAPKGWVPAMRRLRENGPNALARVAREVFPAPEAHEVLTGWLSALHVIDEDGSLRALAEKRPDPNELLIAAAERMGVPSCWLECLWYIHAVMACLQPVPFVILSIRDELNRRIAGADRKSDIAWEASYRGNYLRVPEPPFHPQAAGTPENGQLLLPKR
jgi:hypothetical protein